jgi:uroporphyrinogen-III synthase
MPKVVLLKSESDGNDIFVEELNRNKFAVLSIASIDFGYKNLDTLADKLRKPTDYEGIIFTSPRSIVATQHCVQKDTDCLIKFWCDKRNFTVGEASYNHAKKLLSLETTGKDAGNAQNLSAIIIDDYGRKNLSRPFLFPCGNLKQDILEKNLNERSIALECVEVYETIPHPNLESAVKNLKEQEDDIDFIVFFSPSGVKYSLPFMTHHNVQLSKIKLIAIGPSTKRCMSDNNLECYATCEKPSPESLLDVLSSTVSHQNAS